MKFIYSVVLLIIFLSVSTLTAKIGKEGSVGDKNDNVPPITDGDDKTETVPDDDKATPKPDDSVDKETTTTSGVGFVSHTLLPFFSLIFLVL
ncbi:unnamed protein product [Hymenolepis diminuta]|uniref:Uncharacterized protein n=1 Tax=Hymenolepis diminuta TaxID=6216 RepID=A0A0R3SJW4_HYMDI|nr:unnamed protein product [Hymenolepis diminuta]VUZ45640.1 unnamed protein product [Hymenolepis diminuta]